MRGCRSISEATTFDEDSQRLVAEVFYSEYEAGTHFLGERRCGLEAILGRCRVAVSGDHVGRALRGSGCQLCVRHCCVILRNRARGSIRVVVGAIMGCAFIMVPLRLPLKRHRVGDETAPVVLP
jgi:hypothetical protein